MTPAEKIKAREQHRAEVRALIAAGQPASISTNFLELYNEARAAGYVCQHSGNGFIRMARLTTPKQEQTR